jgi:hypothetical protein
MTYWVIEHETLPGHYLCGPYVRRWRQDTDRALRFADKASCVMAIDMLAPGGEACEVVDPAASIEALQQHGRQHMQGAAA